MDIKGLFTNWIVKNLAIAAAIVLVVVFASNFLLGVLTSHGKSITVPDMANMSVAEARAAAESAGLRIEVTDSSYVRKMKKGAVISQHPTAGSNVKKGRKISLVTNTMNAKKVSMPDLVGRSLREARAELTSKGLFLGELLYQNDIATDNVLGQQFKGKAIRKGTQVETGSTIDIIVGLNNGEGSVDFQTTVPNVVGMKYQRAVDAVHDKSLNVSVIFDKTVKTYSDSLDAVVTKQGPDASDLPIIKGERVSLYLSASTENE